MYWVSSCYLLRSPVSSVDVCNKTSGFGMTTIPNNANFLLWKESYCHVHMPSVIPSQTTSNRCHVVTSTCWSWSLLIWKCKVALRYPKYIYKNDGVRSLSRMNYCRSERSLIYYFSSKQRLNHHIGKFILPVKNLTIVLKNIWYIFHTMKSNQCNI